jgi:hypothetical protein
MPPIKGDEWKHVVVVDDKTASHPKVECVYCSKVFVGGAARIRNHLIRGVLSDVSMCSEVPDDVVRMFKEQVGHKKEVAKKKQRNNELHVATRGPTAMAIGPITSAKSAGIGGGAGPTKSQATVPGLFAAQIGGKETADRAVARFFYASSIPFHAADSTYFKEAIKAVAACGPTYCPPGRKAIGTTLIEKELMDVKRRTEAVKNSCTGQGVTLVSDGWTNVQNRPIINFLMVSSEEAMFLSATDTSGKEKNAEYIADLLEKHIEEVGQEKVVQIVMDSAASCVAAGKLVMKKFPGIVCSPCTAHCLDLLLEDIGKLQWVGDVIKEAHDVVKFLTNHQQALAYYRSHASLELLKPGDTRFATNFIMLQRLQQCKDELQETVVSKEYKQWISKPKYKAAGAMISDVILSNTFWDHVAQVVSLCIPIVDVLRLADGQAPCTGKIYWKMFQAHKSIAETVTLSADGKAQLADLVMKRWTMLHTDLHAAGFVLDPEFQHFLQHENEEVINGFHAMVERVFPGDVESQVKAVAQHSSYRAGHGLYGRAMATAAAKTIPAHRWWTAFGSGTPELQLVATRVLSQCVSASACERNWSTFDFVHTKKRNRLSSTKVNKLVYIHSNLRLVDRIGTVGYTEDTVKWTTEAVQEETDSESDADCE